MSKVSEVVFANNKSALFYCLHRGMWLSFIPKTIRPIGLQIDCNTTRFNCSEPLSVIIINYHFDHYHLLFVS